MARFVGFISVFLALFGSESNAADIKYGNVDGLKVPIKLEKCLLYGGGASNPSPRALAAVQYPILNMFENTTKRIQEDIKGGLRYVLQTNNEWTIALHGTGTAGATAVLDNLIEEGDKILIGINGRWGNMAANISKRFGAEVIRLEKPLGTSFSLEEIKAAIEQHKPQIVYLVTGESSTGVYQEMDGVGELCHKHDCLTIADLVATVVQQPIKMDERKIDAVYMNSQKGIGGSVGLAPVSFSPRAVKKILNRKTKPFMYPHIMTEQAKGWGLDKNKPHNFFHHSYSIPLLHMLRETLAKIVEEGLENAWKRHKETDEYLHEGVTKLGFEFYVPRKEDRCIGTTVFKVPPGKDSLKIESYIFNKYRLEVAPGFGPTVGKAIRIGLFGENANIEAAKAVIEALKDALESPETNAS